MSVGQLVAAVSDESEAEGPGHSRDRTAANNHDLAVHNLNGLPTSVTADRPLDDAFASGSTTHRA